MHQYQKKTYIMFLVDGKNLIPPMEMTADQIDFILRTKLIKIDGNYVAVKDYYYDLNYPSIVLNLEKVDR